MTKEKYPNSNSIYFPLVSFQLLTFNIFLRFVSIEDATLFSNCICLLRTSSVCENIFSTVTDLLECEYACVPLNGDQRKDDCFN